LFGGILGCGVAKIKTQKNGYFLVKSAKTPTKYTLCLDMQIHLTDNEIYSLREEMRVALEGMQQLQLDRQRANALALTEASDSGQAGPDPDGLAPGSDR
jgi:hypothetical protein